MVRGKPFNRSILFVMMVLCMVWLMIARDAGATVYMMDSSRSNGNVIMGATYTAPTPPPPPPPRHPSYSSSYHSSPSHSYYSYSSSSHHSSASYSYSSYHTHHESTIEDQVQAMYVALLGRPADVQGLASWTKAAKERGGIKYIMKDFIWCAKHFNERLKVSDPSAAYRIVQSFLRNHHDSVSRAMQFTNTVYKYNLNYAGRPDIGWRFVAGDTSAINQLKSLGSKKAFIEHSIAVSKAVVRRAFGRVSDESWYRTFRRHYHSLYSQTPTSRVRTLSYSYHHTYHPYHRTYSYHRSYHRPVHHSSSYYIRQWMKVSSIFH